MMCVSGEKEGGREREKGVMICGYEKTLFYIQFPKMYYSCTCTYNSHNTLYTDYSLNEHSQFSH